ncbi:MAG: hypothetical protein IJY52_04870 [Anaerotignum sp.]|nr:hypothetical protein [Anaerotignum sp.]
MAEKNNLEMLSALMGEQGQDALQMMQRMERLKRLMGTAKPAEPPALKKKEEPGYLFSRSKQEDMISAAIPFLDQEYQKEIYVIVRLMEMRRVLQGGFLEVREKREESSALRRRKLLGAIQPYLPPEEQNQMATILKMMDMKEIMGQEERK